MNFFVNTKIDSSYNNLFKIETLLQSRNLKPSIPLINNPKCNSKHQHNP